LNTDRLCVIYLDDGSFGMTETRGKNIKSTGRENHYPPPGPILGVTGHRRIQLPKDLSAGIRSVLDLIDTSFRNLETGASEYTLLSALAEGADRLMAEEVLARKNGRLVAVLPLDPSEYEEDFRTEDLRRTFRDYLSAAERVIIMEKSPDRVTAYENAGRYILDHSDLLIALWDGKNNGRRGGTSHMVDLARSMKKPLFWIHALRPEVIRFEVGGEKHDFASFRWPDFGNNRSRLHRPGNPTE
jgi:hypothetical protein